MIVGERPRLWPWLLDKESRIRLQSQRPSVFHGRRSAQVQHPKNKSPGKEEGYMKQNV